MIDGVKISCNTLDARIWEKTGELEFFSSVSCSTGELMQRKEAKYKGLSFVVTHTVINPYHGFISGSLHKYKNNGEHNADDFTFSDLVKVIEELKEKFSVIPEKTPLHRLEIGANIVLPFKAKRLIDGAICHKGEPFNKMSKKSGFIGCICEHTDYDIKLYDKGTQERLNKNLLRVEIRLKRMRMLGDKIKTLADVCKESNLKIVCDLLLEKIKEIIFFDKQSKLKAISEPQKLRFERYGNPYFWMGKNHVQYCKAKQKYKELVKKYGCMDLQNLLLELLGEKLNFLINDKPKKGNIFHGFLNDGKQKERVTFSTLEYVLENVTLEGRKTEDKQRDKIYKQMKDGKRYCKICGRDISNQKKGSVFCSEKLYGKEAKKCRNKDSNRRLEIRRKIQRIFKYDIFLQIVYTDETGSEYAEIFHPKEIGGFSETWENRILSVCRVDGKGKTMYGESAKEFITTLKKQNDGKRKNKERH